MGANAKDYLRFEMIEEDYKQLSNQTRSKMNLLNVTVDNPKFKTNPSWVEAKKKSTKYFLELKEIEYLINKQK
jgi:hypothetical protein